MGEDPSPHEELAYTTKNAINQKLWDEVHGTYLDYDFAVDLPIHVFFGPNLAGPLYAGIADQDRAKRIVGTLEEDGFGLSDESITPIPSYDLHGFGFSPLRYWRGPVWININWFLMHGLEAYGYEEHAKRVQQTIVDLCREQGFHEYFDPPAVRGSARSSSLGRRRCSWMC